jgi:hypothetical protein
MNRIDLSISMREAAARSLFLIVPIAVLQFVLYISFYKYPGLPDNSNMFILGCMLLIGLLIHELIHMLVWAWLANKPLSAFKIGFQWRTLTPYAHCKEPMDIFPYRVGAFAPGLVLGILPWLFSLFTGDAVFFLFGLLYTTAAGGDLLILWLLRNVRPGTLVEDHPTNAGCYVIEKTN